MAGASKSQKNSTEEENISSAAPAPGMKSKKNMPTGVRTTTLTKLQVLRQALVAQISKNPEKLDITKFKPELPDILDNQRYSNHQYGLSSLRERRLAMNAAAKDTDWTARVTTEVDLNLRHQDYQMTCLALAEFYIEKKMTETMACRFIPTCFLDGAEIGLGAKLFIKGAQSTCSSAKSIFHRRMLVWTIATVLDRAFGETIGKDMHRLQSWFCDRLRFPTTLSGTPLTGRKVAIWLLEPFDKVLDSPFMFNHPDGYLDDTVKTAKREHESYAYLFCGYMAARSYFSAVDQDEQENLQHYWELYQDDFGLSNVALKGHLPDSDDLPTKSVLMKSRKRRVHKSLLQSKFYLDDTEYETSLPWKVFQAISLVQFRLGSWVLG